MALVFILHFFHVMLPSLTCQSTFANLILILYSKQKKKVVSYFVMMGMECWYSIWVYDSHQHFKMETKKFFILFPNFNPLNGDQSKWLINYALIIMLLSSWRTVMQTTVIHWIKNYTVQVLYFSVGNISVLLIHKILTVQVPLLYSLYGYR